MAYTHTPPVASFVVAEIVLPFSDIDTDDHARVPAAVNTTHDAP
jgi:hypothetical protein